MATRAVAQPFGEPTQHVPLTPQEEGLRTAEEAQDAIDVQAKKDAAAARVLARGNARAAMKTKLALSDAEFDNLKLSLE